MRIADLSLHDFDLTQLFPFRCGDYVISNDTHYLSFRNVCLIHHTAQLGVYLRLQGIPVPGFYGPSADEPFGAAK